MSSPTAGLPDGVAATAGAVRSGDVSAVEVVAAHLEAAGSSQDVLNAFTLIDERAVDRAAAIDSEVAAGSDPGSLAGVPLALKDIIDQAGLPNTLGTNWPPEVPARNATVVDRLEAAGAVIIGRAGLHEYAFGFSSENHWFGAVRNPWNTDLSPGGSSGGSAVAVAAHLAAGAVGTDTGGSVRVPAALCGVVGLKVTHGRVSLRGVFPLATSVDTVGPLARSVADAALMYRAMAGYDPADDWSADRAVAAPGGAADVKGLRVAIPHPWVDGPLSSEQGGAFEDIISWLAAAGAEILHLDLPVLSPPGDIEGALNPEVATVHRGRFWAHPETYGPEVAGRVETTLAVDDETAARGREWAGAVKASMEGALQDADVLATPTVAALHKTIGVDSIDVGGEVVPYRAALSWFTALVNQSHFPAIALPLDRQGAPPPSLQLIGPAWSEARLLEIGAALEDGGIVATRPPTGW